MSNIQQQILERFRSCDKDVQQVILETIEFEVENIHLTEPRFKQSIGEILDKVIRMLPEETRHEI